MNALPPPDLGAELLAIAAQVRALVPSWQRPELFHERKSELAARLAALANGGHRAVTPRPPRPAPIVRERVIVRTVVVVLPRHLVRPGRRHRFPRPPRLEAQGRLALDP